MTRGWCSIDEAAEYFGISVPKLEEAMADSERAGIALPGGNHGTAKKAYLRWCAAKLDGWMLEVLAWRRSVSSSAAANIRSDGTTPTASSTVRASRTRKTRSPSSQKSKAPKNAARNTYRERLRLLESTTP